MKDYKQEIKDFRLKYKIPRHIISKETGISESSLRFYESGTRIPSIEKWANLEIYMNSFTTPNNEDKNMEQSALQDLIRYQRTEISSLKKQLDDLRINKKDAWLDIEYDVKTRQFYNKSFVQMIAYKMIKYSDFFKKLGYDDNEIEKEYESHKKNILDLHRDDDDYGIIHKKWMSSGKKISTWTTIDKNGKEIPLTLWLDISKTLDKSIMTYDGAISYIKKDGSHLNAHIYCCWDLQRMSGEAKIKFLNT